MSGGGDGGLEVEARSKPGRDTTVAPVSAPGRGTLVDAAPSPSPPLFGGPAPTWELIGADEVASAAPTKKSKAPPDPLGGYEALLLEALTKGDVPVAEFQNYMRQMEVGHLEELLRRLSATPPPASDKLASAFYQTVPTADRKRITDYMKSRSTDRMWNEMTPGEDSSALQLIRRVDAFEGVHLRSQPSGAKNGGLLPFGTLVAVSRKTEKGWYYVTVLPDEAPEGETAIPAPVAASGFIESYHVASKMPEPSARLHKVQSGELLKDIAAKYYKHGFQWGHDARVFVQAIYHANKDRDAVFRQQADLSVNHEALSTSKIDDALVFWKEARVTAGQGLWMPSNAFVNGLKSAGAIHQASISKTVWDHTGGIIAAAWDFIKYTGGFVLGILEGAWGALVDLFKGVADLLKMVWTLIKDIFNDFAEIKAFAKKISEAWKNRDAIIQEMASQFMDKWENPDDFARGNFQGEFLGYIMMTAFITLVTFGSGAAVVGAGRFGAFIKLIQFADKAGSLGTYVGKLTSKIKLPKGLVAKSKKALTTLGVGGDPPHGHTPDGDAPHVDGGHAPKVDAPHVDKPHVDTPHVPAPPHKLRDPLQNKGGPYVDPLSDVPDAGHAPHAHLDKLPKIKPKPVSSWKKLTAAMNKGKKGVAIGRQLKDVNEGHALLQRLAHGDATALDALGITDVPKGYNTMGREWALVEGREGFFLYAGRYADVELPAGARVHAHNHPDPHASAPLDANQKATTNLNVPQEGKPFTELLDSPSELLDSGLSPSMPDIHAISDGGKHVIYTRFVHRGGGRVANPMPNDTAARIAIHLQGTKVVRYNPRNKEYFYQVSVELRDAAGQKVWSGEMYGQWFAQTGSGIVHHKRPPHLDRDLPAGWVTP
jgi:hypothetical protein